VLGPPKDEDVLYPLADYPSTARAIAEGSRVTGVDLSGSDPAEVNVLHELGYRAVLAVGLVDGQRGYLVEIYSDSDHTELIAVAPNARVLAHYCRYADSSADGSGARHRRRWLVSHKG
jgi:hypothetical protein